MQEGRGAQRLRALGRGRAAQRGGGRERRESGEEAEGGGEEPERVSHTSSPTIMAVTDANGQKSYPCR